MSKSFMSSVADFQSSARHGDAACEQRLNQALAFAIVGDHGTLAREGRVDESWNLSRPPIIAQSHGAADRGARHWATPPSVELAVELKLFLDALEVPRSAFAFSTPATMATGQREEG